MNPISQDILSNYHLYPAKYFSEKWNVSTGYIICLACQLKVTSGYRIKKQIKEICKRYKAGESINDIAAKTGHGSKTIQQLLIKNGFTIRVAGEHSIRYKINKYFFDIIDTEEKAYWLGFLYADGNVRYKGDGKNRRSNMMQICLAPVDTHHVEALRKALGSTHPIVNDRSGPRLIVCNQYLAWALEDLGMMPRKSLTLTFPSLSQVPLKFVRHFIRGYFDGDGCITASTNKKGETHWNFNIISTKPFLEVLRDHLVKYGLPRTSLCQEKRSGNGKIFTLRIGGYVPRFRMRDAQTCSALKLYHFLYDDATVWLDRKRDRFEILLTLLYDNDWR